MEEGYVEKSDVEEVDEGLVKEEERELFFLFIFFLQKSSLFGIFVDIFTRQDRVVPSLQSRTTLVIFYRLLYNGTVDSICSLLLFL